MGKRERATQSWAVVKTHPQKEWLAIENLERQHFATYCPMTRKTLRKRGRLSEVLRPLFPNYVMVQLDPSWDRWRPILSTMGVSTLVRFGDRVGLLDKAFVEGLRAREEEGVIVMPDTPFAAGQTVRMVGGPFEGMVAKILGLKGSERLLVLMDLLERSVRVTVDQRQVTALE